MESNWKKWQGKKAHIILNNNYEYNCQVVEVDDSGNGIIWIRIIDKFGKCIDFTSGEIKFIEEKG
jgi:hypothetical protein